MTSGNYMVDAEDNEEWWNRPKKYNRNDYDEEYDEMEYELYKLSLERGKME